MLSTEDLVCVERSDIMLDGVVGCASQSRAAADGGDHVDLALVGAWERWKCDAGFCIMVVELVKMA
ncbi:unnamed protein product [Prunus armeniaca]